MIFSGGRMVKVYTAPKQFGHWAGVKVINGLSINVLS